MKTLRSIIAILALLIPALSAAERPMVIHEWGTFTSFQNDDGVAQGGINVDDEPLPKFVKSIAPDLIRYGEGSKGGLQYAHPHITMRLETPVVYFHPPAGMKLPHTMDLSVSFKGGWLTQYFPDAQAVAPGLGSLYDIKGEPKNTIAPIFTTTVGSLTWKGLQVGVDGSLMPTESKVWNAPRKVDAATVANSAGAVEKYLFYRGVGNVRPPFQVRHGGKNNSDLVVVSHCYQYPHEMDAISKIKTLWYAHFLPDGTCAFKEWHPDIRRNQPSMYWLPKGMKLPPPGFSPWRNYAQGYEPVCLRQETFAAMKSLLVNAIPATFSPGQFAKENLPLLKKSMRESLIEDGLFADEADALLNTWEVSYFKNPGLRLFFLVPKTWTDHVLPLSVSEPADIVRTMVGRIELISPEQRAALDEMSKPGFLKEGVEVFKSNEAFTRAYTLARNLGRFTRPLFSDRLRTNPTPDLKFIARQFSVQEYKIDAPVPVPPTR